MQRLGEMEGLIHHASNAQEKPEMTTAPINWCEVPLEVTPESNTNKDLGRRLLLLVGIKDNCA